MLLWKYSFISRYNNNNNNIKLNSQIISYLPKNLPNTMKLLKI